MSTQDFLLPCYVIPFNPTLRRTQHTKTRTPTRNQLASPQRRSIEGLLGFHRTLQKQSQSHLPYITSSLEQPEDTTEPSSSFSAHLLTVPLSPPNNEVDWVIVDVLLQDEDDLPSYATDESFQVQVNDDVKSLVRVALRDAPVEISIVLCTDAYIRSLNAEWRGKDVETDVLSFPQHDPDGVLLGDIVISVETALKQANERDSEFCDEVRILLVHGLLHLLGYDHEGEKEGDWLIMAKMENRFLKQLQWKGEGLVAVAQDPLYRKAIES